MRLAKILFLQLIIYVLSDCSPKRCYDVRMQFDVAANLKNDIPVLIGNGIVGYTKLFKNRTGYEAKICMPNPVKIPIDSRVVEGYSERLGTIVQINLGSRSEVFDDGDLMVVTHKDTILIERTKSDSAIIKKVIDVISHIKQTREKK